MSVPLALKLLQIYLKNPECQTFLEKNCKKGGNLIMGLPPEQVISFSLLILFPHLTITGLQLFLHVGKPALLRKVFGRNSGVPFHYTAYFTTYAVMRLFQVTLSCDTMPFYAFLCLRDPEKVGGKLRTSHRVGKRAMFHATPFLKLV